MNVKALKVRFTDLIVNQKLALIALAVLIWRTLNSELTRLQQAPLGNEAHEKFAERFGTRTMGRKRPYGAGTESEVSSRNPAY